jgi:endonuclease III
MTENQSNNGDQITMQQPGKEPVVLTNTDAVKIINTQREHIAKMIDEMNVMNNKNKELIEIINIMQKQNLQKSNSDQNTTTDQHTNIIDQTETTT